MNVKKLLLAILLSLLVAPYALAGINDRYSGIDLTDDNRIDAPQIAAPNGNPITDRAWIYIKASGSTTGLYFEDDTGTVGEVTLLGQTISESELTTAAADGLHPNRIARATYDFASDGGAISTIGLGVTLPDNAIITRAWYEVLTTLTSATDAATVAIDIPTDDAGGIVAAIAISDVSNVWDAGSFEAIQTGTVANFSEKTTAARELSATIAVEAVTAGKFILYAEYIVSD